METYTSKITPLYHHPRSTFPPKCRAQLLISLTWAWPCLMALYSTLWWSSLALVILAEQILPSLLTQKKTSKKIRQQIYPICKRHLPLSQGKLCVTVSKQSLRLDFCFSCSLESFGSMKTMKIPKFGANENDSTTNLFVKSRKGCGSFFIVVLVLTFSRLQSPEMFDASTSPSWSTLKNPDHKSESSKPP